MSGHEVEEGGAGGSREPFTGRPLPLHSKKMTGPLLKQLGRGLEVTDVAPPDELRAAIKEKLVEMGREPKTVQVRLQETRQGVRIGLQDASGLFLDLAPGESDGDNPDEDRDKESEGENIEDDVETLRKSLEEVSEQKGALQAEVSSLQEELAGEKERVKELWKVNCMQLSEFDAALTAKEEEIQKLQEQLALSHPRPPSHSRSSSRSSMLHESDGEEDVLPVRSVSKRRGKAPPVDAFTGETPEVRLDDWLPALQRAAEWNGWSQAELLIQLAGHLRGRALQEWNLLGRDERTAYGTAVAALRSRLDPGSKAMAAQDFRHISQRENESTSSFIRRLERTFQLAYGRDGMLSETRDALLYSQLQEGLRDNLMEAPAVSGALNYQALCIAAKNEERRQTELKKRKQYHKPPTPPRSSGRDEDSRAKAPNLGATKATDRKCYFCERVGHISRNCPQRRAESSGKPPEKPKPTYAKKVKAAEGESGSTASKQLDPLELLYSSSEEEETDVRLVRVSDSGSQTHCAKVQVQGVPAFGIIDSGADITIIGGTLFRKVATVARLRKRDFKKADKTPRAYDQQPFSLDGRMDLDISFGDLTMCTPVYIKMNAPDQLLLSEGVCRQLGIVKYHEDVQKWRGGQKPAVKTGTPKEAKVPSIRVKLVQSVRLSPQQSTVVQVHVDNRGADMPVYVERNPQLEDETGLRAEDALLLPDADGHARMVVSNPSSYTQVAECGTTIGEVMAATVVEVEASPEAAVDLLAVSDSPEPQLKDGPGEVRRVMESDDILQRKQRLRDVLPAPGLLDPSQQEQLYGFLTDHHQAFCLDELERGETDLIQLHIDTGDASARKQPVRRMPFAVREEVARQLRKMQATGVIQPSCSPWASPVVMVKKKDGSHRFCVDYRALNSVTKADTFPLPRIEDLLDQLGESNFFSTLDLASGYWQIRVHPDSQEKTAFVTPQGLYEFRVMPFGLTNAPAVFQRLMQRVLMGLNPEDGPDYVTVYIDDVLVFSRTLAEHLEHLRKVIRRLQEVGLKLKPAKCQFIREEVEYLGHLITPQGLKPNPRLVEAVQEFATPRDLRRLRQFLGLSSYSRRFVPSFAKIAQPLNQLTRKGVEFIWTDECQEAFTTLKQKLTTAPVLAYPSFSRDFVLETDASTFGLGAVLSQPQEDGRTHPVAYASRALSPQEANYSVTELETLAVVWAVTYFHTYLYGHRVTVFTDHTAVKALLETPSPSGKHARWWMKVYGRGIKEVKIVYRSGKTNLSADALSRSPHMPAPIEGIAQTDVQVSVVDSSDVSIESLLRVEPAPHPLAGANSLPQEQRKDPVLLEIINFLEKGELPSDEGRARKIALQSSMFVLMDDVLYFVDTKQSKQQRVVVPMHLRPKMMEENHRGPMGAHFSGNRLFNALSRHWWWEGMFVDTMHYVRNCPECATVSGGGKGVRPPLHPIPVNRPFQIVGVDIMELPKTTQGNKYVLVFQDFLTKWPMAYPIPDQKSQRIADILVREVVPFFGVPENLLSDRGANLLSHLMMDICKLLGIHKLNTTAYHPQCNGMVERFNRTLKTALRKHAARFGTQWDKYLSGVMWAYRNTPHESTGEKPSFLLFGIDCRTPTEAALLPPAEFEPIELEDYREEVIQSLSSARELAVKAMQKAQKRYKVQYDRKSAKTKYRLGDWVMVRFPHEETGKQRKLSQPWHGPFRVVSCDNPDLTVVKIYFPQDGSIRIHQTRVTPCPDDFPAGYYWYGRRRHSPGRPPQWLETLADVITDDDNGHSNAVAAQEPTVSTRSDTEDVTESESEPDDEDATPQPESDRTHSSRYTFRNRVKPPERLMRLSSGRAPSKEGVM